MNGSYVLTSSLTLSRRASGHGLAEWFARLIVRGATYRVLFGLPLPVVLVMGAVALGFLVSRRNRGGA